jgi:MFS family permease
MVKLGLGEDLIRNNRNFARLWVSGSVNGFTSQFSDFAFPVLAVLVFHATPFEMGLLIALEILPLPIISPFVGVWVDRVRRLGIIIACNLAQMAALASVPIGYFLHFLSLDQIFAVILIAGFFEVIARTAYQSYFPTIIAREDLLEGNQAMQTMSSAASVVGPGVAGFLYQIVGGAASVAIDAVGFLFAAIMLRGNTEKERKVAKYDKGVKGFLSQMHGGFKFALGNKILRGVAACGVWSSLGNSMADSMFTVFALNYVLFSPATLGLIGSIGSVAFLVGVLLAKRIVKFLGVGATMALSITTCLVQLLEPSALYGYAFIIFIVVVCVKSFGAPVYTIPQVAVKQAITPHSMQGRMNATMNTMVWGMMVVGATLGGILGSTIGVVNTIYLGAAISGTSGLAVLLSPVIRLKQPPEQVSEPETLEEKIEEQPLVPPSETHPPQIGPPMTRTDEEDRDQASSPS